MLLAEHNGHRVEYTEGPGVGAYCFDAACTCGWSGSWPDPGVRGLVTGAHMIGIPEAAE